MDSKNKHPSEASAVRVFQMMIRVFKPVTLQVQSYSVHAHCLPVENVCVYGISTDTVFNNSVIAICKLFHGTHSSQQEEQFER